MSAAPRETPELPRPDGSVRDGIGEDDHPIPLWFNVSFYGTLLIGIAYMAYYLLSAWSSAGQYQAEVAAATQREAALRASRPAGNPYRGDAQALAAGAEVFAQICVACHKPDGSGLVGPSLVDPYWKYGSSDEELFATVTNGRPGGMPPWGAQLGSEKIWKVLAYLETLPRSDEPGIGAPDFVPPGS